MASRIYPIPLAFQVNTWLLKSSTAAFYLRKPNNYYTQHGKLPLILYLKTITYRTVSLPARLKQFICHSYQPLIRKYTIHCTLDTRYVFIHIHECKCRHCTPLWPQSGWYVFRVCSLMIVLSKFPASLLQTKLTLLPECGTIHNRFPLRYVHWRRLTLTNTQARCHSTSSLPLDQQTRSRSRLRAQRWRLRNMHVILQQKH